ncbi:hypothetical protein P8452_29703 [Trifolium repens]|nr:hypothetical protein P8452_29703 [Trifolium repens]
MYPEVMTRGWGGVTKKARVKLTPRSKSHVTYSCFISTPFVAAEAVAVRRKQLLVVFVLVEVVLLISCGRSRETFENEFRQS